jgi:flagellar protein FliS
MDLQKVTDIYKETSLATVPIIEVKIKLLELCLYAIEKGKTAIEENEFISKNEYLKKAQQLMSECMSLTNSASEHSKSVLSIYEYINRLLIEANTKRNSLILCEAESILIEMLDAWQDANRNSRKRRFKGDTV